MLPPFPPYTQALLQQRFPKDRLAHQRLSALHDWLVAGETPEHIQKQTRSPRASLYRWRKIWETEGIAGLLTPSTTRRPLQWDQASVRTLLRLLPEQTSFSLACHPIVTNRLANVRDPATRGQRLTAALRAGIAAADRHLTERYGCRDLLQTIVTDDLAIKALPDRFGVSRSQLYRWVQYGINHLAAHLPDLLTRLPVPHPWHVHLLDHPTTLYPQEAAYLSHYLTTSKRAAVIGLSGMGKSTLVAAVADQWATAGWIVVWVRLTPLTPHPIETLLQTITTQLATYGVLQNAKLDPTQAITAHSNHLQATIAHWPVLLVIDDSQIALEQPDVQQFIQRWLSSGTIFRIIIVGQICPWSSLPTVSLQGIDASTADECYRQWVGPQIPESWDSLWHQTGGNPALLRLAAQQPYGSIEHINASAAALVQASLHTLPETAWFTLLWLMWWDAPLAQHHPFLHAMPHDPQILHALHQHSLITMAHEQLMLHDLVRRALPHITPPTLWQTVRQHVQHVAEQHEWWDVAYRCANDEANRTAQQRISTTAAQAYQQRHQFRAAASWWERVIACTDASDTHTITTARLAQIGNLLDGSDHDKAAASLAQLPSPETPETQWWYMLYQARNVLFTNPTAAQAEALLDHPILQTPPAHLATIGRWQIGTYRAFIHWYRGKLVTAWHIHRTLPEPPPGCDLPLKQMYFTTGMTIGLSLQHITTEQRFLRQLQALSYRHAPSYPALCGLLDIGRVLWYQERYTEAERRLAHTIRQLDVGWHNAIWRGYFYQGWVKLALGKYHQAWECAQQSMAAIAQFSNEDFGHTTTGLLQATLAWWIGDTETTIAALTRAYQAHQRYEQFVHQSDVCLLHAKVALHQGDSTQALQWLRRTTHLLRRCHGRHNWAKLLCGWGNYYLAQQQWRRAMHIFGRATALALHAQRPISQALALDGYSHALWCQGHGEQALVASQQATLLLHGHPRGIWAAPHIWARHAQQLTALGAASDAAWQQAALHLQAQMRHLGPQVDITRWVQQIPYEAIIVANRSMFRSISFAQEKA